MSEVRERLQSEAIDKLRHSLRSGKRRPILQAPVGFGKTIVAAKIVEMARTKRKRVVFVCDAISLIDQTVDRFYDYGLRGIGVIQASHPMTDYDQPIQVASIQTLERRMAPDFDMAIGDEVHVVYKRWLEMMTDNPAKPFIGLTATPWTKGLGNHYDDLIVAATMRQCIEEGILCGFRAYAPSHPDLRGVKITAGDYNEADLAKVMGDDSLIADIVRTWQERAKGRPTLAFCVDRDHARTLQVRFISAGIGCGYIDAYTKADERREIERQLNAGEIDVVTSVGTLIKGVDWSVGCVIMARPTKSASLFVQAIGRGLRQNTGRAAGDCIILDHTDTVLRLGFPTDIHRDTLCTAKKGERQKPERQAPTPRECPSCQRLTVGKCPCGYERPKQASLIGEGAGELAELTGGRSSDQVVKPKKAQPVDKAQWWAMLKHIEIQRGKSDKWALAMFKKRFQHWPINANKVVPMSPTPEIVSWVRGMNIRYAKGMANARSATVSPQHVGPKI